MHHTLYAINPSSLHSCVFFAEIPANPAHGDYLLLLSPRYIVGTVNVRFRYLKCSTRRLLPQTPSRPPYLQPKVTTINHRPDPILIIDSVMRHTTVQVSPPPPCTVGVFDPSRLNSIPWSILEEGLDEFGCWPLLIISAYFREICHNLPSKLVLALVVMSLTDSYLLICSTQGFFALLCKWLCDI